MSTNPNEQPDPARDEPGFDEPGSLANRPEAEPDAPPLDELAPDQRSGGLVAEDEGAHTLSRQDSLARDTNTASGPAGSEEAAMHVADADVRDMRQRDADAAGT